MKSLFAPRDNCPVKPEGLANIWKGETWFGAKLGARERYNEQVKAAQVHAPTQQGTEAASAQKLETSKNKAQRSEQQLAPSTKSKAVRSLVEKTAHEAFQQTNTSIPGPATLQHNNDWIPERPYWKRVHVKLRTALYKPEQTPDGHLPALHGVRQHRWLAQAVEPHLQVQAQHASYI